jgi:hypothetical protein
MDSGPTGAFSFGAQSLNLAATALKSAAVQVSSVRQHWSDHTTSCAVEFDHCGLRQNREFLALPCAAEPLLSRRATPPGNALEAVG